MSLQSISVVTLGIGDLERSRRFYSEGFGWAPVFENDEILFYQMNGLVLGLWLADKLAEDMKRGAAPPGSFSLAHNVPTKDNVDAVIDRLIASGGVLLRKADAPPHGGYRGYVADPDGHSWESRTIPPGRSMRRDTCVSRQARPPSVLVPYAPWRAS